MGRFRFLCAPVLWHQIAFLYDKILSSQIQHTLWTTYLQFSTGPLQTSKVMMVNEIINNHHYSPKIYPIEVKTKVQQQQTNRPPTNNITDTTITNEMYLTVIHEHLNGIQNRIQRYQNGFDIQRQRLSS